MVEPITTIGVGAIAAYLGSDGVQKLLGPTAEYLGSGLKDFVERRVATIGRMFHVAEVKLGAQLDQPGQIPPKVLKEILDEGSFANDDLAVEYLGGILASSRTEAGRDDRGARIAKLVNRLSTYQLRTHYLLYISVRNAFAASGFNMGMIDRPKMRMFIPFSGYSAAMDFSQAEQSEYENLLAHIFFGLHTEGLIEDAFLIAPVEEIKKSLPAAAEGGVIFQPSALGTELFMWALGQSGLGMKIFDPSFAPAVDNMPNGIPGAKAVSDMLAAAAAQ